MKIHLLVIPFLFLGLGLSQLGLAQSFNTPQNINGVINRYVAVTAINNVMVVDCSFLSSIDVTSAVGFAAGDFVMIIQMQGGTIDRTNTTAFGGITAMGNAGNYEFNEIHSITGNRLFFRSQLANNYTVAGRVQVVRVPEYRAGATVTGGFVTAQPWNGASGGVVAMIVRGTLTLADSISASNQGFRGGAAFLSADACGRADYNIALGTFDADYDAFFYPETVAPNFHGRKGEGILPTEAAFQRGKGAWSNGGGGGNAHDSGGGGGGNRSSGGRGGGRVYTTFATCHFQFYNGGGPTPVPRMVSGGGYGGYALTPSATRIFMGGGGGAGQQSNVLQGGGGVGGGIIVIRASQLAVSGANRQIVANGQLGSFSAGGDGSGGGGAGGSIYLNLANSSNVTGGFNLTVRAQGGQGGRVSNGGPNACHGPGGGGGGGVIRISNLPSANVIVQRNGGVAGLPDIAGSCTQNLGQPGTEGLTEINPFINDSPCALTLLPVELVFFRATTDVATGRSLLDWSTASEKDSRYFVVERSKDGRQYVPIGQVGAAGQSARRIDYQFVDVQPLPGTSYYRLQQVDNDGSFAYSKIVAVYFTEQAAQLTVFPNPVKDRLMLRLTNLAAGTIVVRLTNLLGQEIYHEIIQHGGNYQLEREIEIGHLANGQYLMTATAQSGQLLHQKVSKE